MEALAPNNAPRLISYERKESNTGDIWFFRMWLEFIFFLNIARVYVGPDEQFEFLRRKSVGSYQRTSLAIRSRLIKKIGYRELSASPVTGRSISPRACKSHVRKLACNLSSVDAAKLTSVENIG